MLRRQVLFTKTVPAIILGLCILIFGEGVIIYFSIHYGVWISTLLLATISTPFCFYIVQFYERTLFTSSRIKMFDDWIRRKEDGIDVRWHKIAQTSKFLAITFSSLVSGVFITSILVPVLGFRGRKAYIITLYNVLAFYLFWTSLYSGAFEIIRKFI